MATGTVTMDDLLAAILPHVAFDGWTEGAFRAALADRGADPAEARALCPRGAVDLAVHMHKRGDAAMLAAMAGADSPDMRIRDRIAQAIRLRIAAIDDKEAVRRATTLFALPHMAPEGARLIWGTADAIWSAIGDSSEDVNWYTKRATLSAVHGSVVLYWLGDDSPGHEATNAFIDRRIDDVMQVEKVKAAVNGNPLLKPFTVPLNTVLGMIRAPRAGRADDLPGRWTEPGGDHPV
ncbi:MAG: hypothetical protein HLUCCA08_01115 [Rhodobacteraceae bacterium HLUCCA08]|nr:MAG: hypothetical protein HLUCCA08_01115 [Rhodobacteraceae bacterium HLUCCA08]